MVKKLLPLVKTNMAASMYHQLELKQTRFNIDLTLFFFNIAQEIHDGFGGRIIRWGAVINEIIKDWARTDYDNWKRVNLIPLDSKYFS